MEVQVFFAALQRPSFLGRLFLCPVQIEDRPARKAEAGGRFAPVTAFLISGPPGSGKTTALRHMLESNAAEGRSILAVAQPDCGRLPDGTALGFDLELLASGSACMETARSAGLMRADSGVLYLRSLPLARRSGAAETAGVSAVHTAPHADPDTAASAGCAAEASPIQNWGPFGFYAAAFDTALDFMSSGLREHGAAPLLIGIDEIGPLELRRRQGLWPVLHMCIKAAAAAESVAFTAGDAAAPATMPGRSGPLSLALCIRPSLLTELSTLLEAQGFSVEPKILSAPFRCQTPST